MVERSDIHRTGWEVKTYNMEKGYVYILKSEKNGRYYIGSTNNLERRIIEHNSGKTKSLKYILPIKLVFKKEYKTLIDAHRMELYLKKLKNRGILDRIIREGDIKTGL